MTMKICVNLRVNYIQINYGRKYCLKIEKGKGKNFESARIEKVVLDKFLKPYFRIYNSKHFQDGEPRYSFVSESANPCKRALPFTVLPLRLQICLTKNKYQN